MTKDTADVTAKSIELLRRLVAFDTTSRLSNLAMIDFIAEYLSGFGVESTRVFDETGGKANLYATLGPADIPGIALSGHTDVVPVDGQDWKSDPFVVDQRDGRLYGRGTADMKGFIAIVLAFVPKFLEAGLQTPVHLAFSYDEEVGCIGVRRLIELINGLSVKPRLCIVGEPTDMKVVVAHKGKRSLSVEVIGTEAHSSLAPQAVNAVEYAAELIAFIKGCARGIARDGPFDDAFDVPHSTVHVGVIKGGTALNIVPRLCRLEFEIRFLPNDDPDSLLARIKAHARDVLEPQMRVIAPEAGFLFTEQPVLAALDTPPDADVVAFVKALAGRNDHVKVAFGTEAGLFQHSAGIPSVVCGPGSIGDAHKPDEFLDIAQIKRCQAFMERLLAHVKRPGQTHQSLTTD